MITKQQGIAQAWDWFIVYNNPPGINDDKTVCTYNSPHRCAIGCQNIPDNLRRLFSDNHQFAALPQEAKNLFEDSEGNFWLDLQDLHDRCSLLESPFKESFARGLVDLAEEYNLSIEEG